ncbi:hypothetical protein JTE90_010371 [Oedothorax gibbosus]|uniref:Uncharacterized protein n=1 Tax=Oedothorax gibbosus TaxID=931172 RepID=A0AAV6W546_9ARAC|nr:hypothetical protein JTE90_010371 [Oedothorax gibbosus]
MASFRELPHVPIKLTSHKLPYPPIPRFDETAFQESPLEAGTVSTSSEQGWESQESLNVAKCSNLAPESPRLVKLRQFIYQPSSPEDKVFPISPDSRISHR